MDAQGTWAERIVDVVDVIQRDLDDDGLDPHRLAAMAGFSRHHFHRVFRGMTGETVMGMVRRLRMERAAQHLKFGDAPVTDIALASGYASHEAFTRAFRARFGISPRAFRAEHQPAIEAVAPAGRLSVLPEVKVLSLRHVGPYSGVPEAWGRFQGYVGAAGRIADIRGSYALIYDDPDVVEASALRYDACLALEGPLEPLLESYPELRPRTLPGGQYACLRHVGSYDDMHPSYVALLGGWLPTRGVELYDEPVLEIYLNEPDQTPAAELQTDICVRIID